MFSPSEERSSAVPAKEHSSHTVPRVVCLSSYMKCFRYLFTKIRDRNTGRMDFVKYSDRLMSVLCEEGLSYALDVQGGRGGGAHDVITPTDSIYKGVNIDLSSITGISIIRAGDSLLQSFLKIIPEATVGKILIQRNEQTSLPDLYYTKLPSILESSTIFLLDPMLATGGSAICAIKEILGKTQALERNILFLSVVASPEGITALHSAYPDITIVAAEIDEGLNELNYIIPGLGDYGDRYYGTK